MEQLLNAYLNLHNILPIRNEQLGNIQSLSHDEIANIRFTHERMTLKCLRLVFVTLPFLIDVLTEQQAITAWVEQNHRDDYPGALEHISLLHIDIEQAVDVSFQQLTLDVARACMAASDTAPAERIILPPILSPKAGPAHRLIGKESSTPRIRRTGARFCRPSSRIMDNLDKGYEHSIIGSTTRGLRWSYKQERSTGLTYLTRRRSYPRLRAHKCGGTSKETPYSGGLSLAQPKDKALRWRTLSRSTSVGPPLLSSYLDFIQGVSTLTMAWGNNAGNNGDNLPPETLLFFCHLRMAIKR
ncbi:hypothetical protein F5877DRAFT_79656 [Lentinula edodes]|nr:hypothetical protein F5877DRAFT_79656 [Lentinula edodes]